MLATDSLKCWGNNAEGQIGDGTQTQRLLPVAVLTQVTAVAAGGAHTCAVLKSGVVFCWGLNRYGQLGDGTQERRLNPTRVRGLKGVSAVAAGTAHTCALLTNGQVWCWGQNSLGQLGDGTTGHRSTPVRVPLTNVTAIAAGLGHTCALRLKGAARCWGHNFEGQLGDGTRDQSLKPEPVKSRIPFTVVSAGDYHTCGVLETGSARCWGQNSSGQIGDDTRERRLTPTRIKGLSPGTRDVIAMGAGGKHSCAVLDSGEVRCWGENTSGQIGDNTQKRRLTAVPVKDLANRATAVALGYAHSCALLGPTDSEVMCWGENTHGQLGDGTQESALTPGKVKRL